MERRMTIHLDAAVYEGLYRTHGKQRMSQFINNFLLQHMLGATPDDGDRAMAADQEREAKALACCNAMAVDAVNEAQRNLVNEIRLRSG